MAATLCGRESASVFESTWPADPRHEKPSQRDLNDEEPQSCPPHMAGGGKTLPTWRLVLVYLSLSVAIMLAIMDLTIVSTALYTISQDFGSLATSYWVLLAYSLTELGLTVISSHVGDFLGRPKILLLSFVLFLAFSFGAGFANSLPQLIICRAFQGASASGLYALSIVIMVEVSPPRMLPMIGGLIGGVGAFSGVLGPIIGGLLTRYLSWRWIFWINGPIAFLAAIGFIIAFPSPFYGRRNVGSGGRFDAIGSILLLSASVLVVFGLQQGGIGAFPWNSGVVVATLVAGWICWIALLAWETLVSRTNRYNIAAIIPVSVLSRQSLWANMLIILTTGFTFFAVVLLLPLRLQIVNLKTPASTGVQMLPLLFAGGVGSFTAGAVARKSEVSSVLVPGTALILLGSGLMTTLSPSQGLEPKLYGFQVLLGFGIGVIFAATSVAVSLQVESRFQSVCQGIASQARLFGGSIGVAAANAVTNQALQTNLAGKLSPAQIHSLQYSTNSLQSLNETQRQLVRIAYADSFEGTMKVCVYVSAAGLLLNLCIMATKHRKQKALNVVQPQSKEIHTSHS